MKRIGVVIALVLACASTLFAQGQTPRGSGGGGTVTQGPAGASPWPVLFSTPQHIVCDSGCGSPPASADGTAFVAGTTNVSLIGAAFNDAMADLASGTYAAPRITKQRALHVNLRDASGNEITTFWPTAAATPLAARLTDGAAFYKATTPSDTQPVSVADGSNVTQGAKADTRSTATDATPITLMQVFKEISFMEQNPAARTVTVLNGPGAVAVNIQDGGNSIMTSDGVLAQATGSITTVGASCAPSTNCVSMSGLSNMGSALVLLSGTYSGFNGTFEASLDSGTTFFAWNVVTQAGTIASNASPGTNVTIAYLVSLPGSITDFRLRGTALTSGSVGVRIAPAAAPLAALHVTADAGTNTDTSLLAREATLGRAIASTTSGQTGPLIQGAVTTNAPVYVSGQTDPLSLDTAGLLRASLKDTPSNTNNFNVNLAASAATVTTNVAQLAGTTTSVNSGTKDNGTLRVVIATDQPALTNKLLVTPDSVALPANQSVNVNQFAGSNALTGAGAGGAGVPRVTVSNDSTVGLVAGTAEIGNVKNSGTFPTQGTDNVTQFGGSNVLTGTGTGGAGIPRVTVSNDSTVGLVAGTQIIGRVGIDQTTPGTTNKVSLGADVVTVSQGTAANLNMTEASAAAIKADVDKIPSQGQALASGSMPVVLPALQVTAMTPPPAITGFALEAGAVATVATNTSATQTTFGSTTAPTKLDVVAGRTNDQVPQYQPIPLTSNGQAVNVTVANLPQTQRVLAMNTPLAPAYASVINLPTTPDRSSLQVATVDAVAPPTVLAAVNDAVYLQARGMLSFGVTIQSGLSAAALAAECSMDGGTSWTPTYFDQQNASKVSILNLTATTTYPYQSTIVAMGGCGLYRVRVMSVSSGSTLATMRGTMAADPSVLFAAPNGSPNAPPATALVSGLDASGIVRAVAVTSSGMAQVQAFAAPSLPLLPCNPVRRTNCQPKGF